MIPSGAYRSKKSLFVAAEAAPGPKSPFYKICRGVNSTQKGKRKTTGTRFASRQGCVYKGRLSALVTVGRQSSTLGAGSFAFIASNEEHSIRNPGTAPAEYFVLELGAETS